MAKGSKTPKEVEHISTHLVKNVMQLKDRQRNAKGHSFTTFLGSNKAIKVMS